MQRRAADLLQQALEQHVVEVRPHAAQRREVVRRHEREQLLDDLGHVHRVQPASFGLLRYERRCCP